MQKKYLLLLPFVIWWFPLVGPVIEGFIIGYSSRKATESLLYSLYSSVIGSLLTSFILIYFIKIPLLGNFFPFLVILLNVIGSIACIAISYLMSSRGVYATITPSGTEIQFHVNNMDEIDNIIKDYVDLSMCSKPTYKFISDDNIEISRDCSNVRVVYDVKRDGKKYLVTLKIESL
ncbi:MAG: hypothetical protein OWQ54_05090 [Sulfolobaceae archaeon]|nr:hypothetical protein [Sulfolobaceae archaeon]